jgi:hypothetical protein
MEKQTSKWKGKTNMKMKARFTKEEDHVSSIPISRPTIPEISRVIGRMWAPNIQTQSTCAELLPPSMVQHDVNNIRTGDALQHKEDVMSLHTNVPRPTYDRNFLSLYPVTVLSRYLNEFSDQQNDRLASPGTTGALIDKISDPSMVFAHLGLTTDDVNIRALSKQRMELFCEICLWVRGQLDVGSKQEIEILHQVIPRIHPLEHPNEQTLERVSRLECFLTLLRMTLGDNWYRPFLGTNQTIRGPLIRSKIVDILLSPEFQMFLRQAGGVAVTSVMNCHQQSLHQQQQLLPNDNNHDQFLVGDGQGLYLE